jgi:hypothetical protein
MIFKSKTKNKLLLLTFLLATILILQISLASAALCKSPSGYYEDCGCDDDYYSHRSQQHLDYHYKDHVYEQKNNYYPKPIYTKSYNTYKTYKALNYQPTVYYYQDKNTHLTKRYSYNNKDNNFQYKHSYLQPTFQESAYTYEPTYNRPTYLVHKNTYRY